MVAEGEFLEEDEPVEDLLSLLDYGVMQLDNVACDDEQEPILRGSCEFATGIATFNPAPVVELCGRPGKARRGIMWCEVYACDECYTRWTSRAGRK